MYGWPTVDVVSAPIVTLSVFASKPENVTFVLSTLCTDGDFAAVESSDGLVRFWLPLLLQAATKDTAQSADAIRATLLRFKRATVISWSLRDISKPSGQSARTCAHRRAGGSLGMLRIWKRIRNT